LVFLIPSPLLAWGDDLGGEKEVKRPYITGAHSWRYNSFSSYDQLRVNFEREFARGQKNYVSVNALYYQEDANKTWDVYPGETYYKFKAGKFDFKMGLIIETLGSGDKISFLDKINSRRYHNGLAIDYNRDKMEVPALKTTYYISKRVNLEMHYLPLFQASDITSIYSRWASAFQTTLAKSILFGAKLQSEDDVRLREQYHFAINTTFPKFELRFHYFKMKDRLPVVE